MFSFLSFFCLFFVCLLYTSLRRYIQSLGFAVGPKLTYKQNRVCLCYPEKTHSCGQQWQIPFSSFALEATKQHSDQLMLSTRREYYFNIFNLDNSFPVLEFPNAIIRAWNKQRKKDTIEIACYHWMRNGGGAERLLSGTRRNLWAWVNIFLLGIFIWTITVDCGFIQITLTVFHLSEITNPSRKFHSKCKRETPQTRIFLDMKDCTIRNS